MQVREEVIKADSSFVYAVVWLLLPLHLTWQSRLCICLISNSHGKAKQSLSYDSHSTAACAFERLLVFSVS